MAKKYEIDRFDANRIWEDSLKRCILELGLESPEELCGLHNDSHLAPIKMKSNVLSYYWKKKKKRKEISK